MKETITRFIKGNPLLSAIILLIVCVGAYYLVSTLWLGAKVAYSDYLVAKLEAERKELKTQLDAANIQIAKDEVIIDQKTEEVEKKDALLKAASEAIVNDKKLLDDVTATASSIMGDTTPLSRDELKSKLCELYKHNPPKGCL